jgi:tetratricopeptide (TPR) repeat protein
LVALAREESFAERQRVFLQAVETFESAKTPDDFRRSAELFESLVHNGLQSGIAFFNAGNAYFKSGDFGKAILCYRKAQQYRPRDPYLHANLQQALSSSPGRHVSQSVPLWKRLLFWGEWLSLSEKTNVATSAGVLAAVFAFLGYWRKSTLGIWLAAIAFGVSLAFAVEYVLSSPDWLATPHAVVVTETIARKGTDDSYEPAFDRPLQDGAEFDVLDSTKGWTFGHFEGIGDGWVKNEHIAR